MKTNLLTFCIFLGSFFSISLAYGDDIPTQGRWDDEDYRSITALPPTLSIDNNILSIEFKDALDNLTIHITDENSNILYIFRCDGRYNRHSSERDANRDISSYPDP